MKNAIKVINTIFFTLTVILFSSIASADMERAKPRDPEDITDGRNYFEIHCEYKKDGSDAAWISRGGFSKGPGPSGGEEYTLINELNDLGNRYINLKDFHKCNYTPIDKTTYNTYFNYLLADEKARGVDEMVGDEENMDALAEEAINAEIAKWGWDIGQDPDAWLANLNKYPGKFWEFTCVHHKSEKKEKFYSLDGWTVTELAKDYYNYNLVNDLGDEVDIPAEHFGDCTSKETTKNKFMNWNKQFK